MTTNAIVAISILGFWILATNIILITLLAKRRTKPRGHGLIAPPAVVRNGLIIPAPRKGHHS